MDDSERKARREMAQRLMEAAAMVEDGSADSVGFFVSDGYAASFQTVGFSDRGEKHARMVATGIEQALASIAEEDLDG